MSLAIQYLMVQFDMQIDINQNINTYIRPSKYMVRRDPDDIITATSKNLKKQKTQVMRLTFKRGGQHTKLYAKAHSRIARRDLKKKIREQANQNPNQTWPLYVRYKEGAEKMEQGEEGQQVEAIEGQGKYLKQNKRERIRLNCEIKLNHANNFISSLLGVFRVNFFKKKEQQGKKVSLPPTKANPNSKTSKKKIAKNKKNRERRLKRKQINKVKIQQQKQIKNNKIKTEQATITSAQN